jgi:anti-anti-sigma regulatory factor
MVFSFFGKKDPPPKPAAKRPAAGASLARSVPDTRPPSTVPGPEIAEISVPDLDFKVSESSESRAGAIPEHIEIREASASVHPVVEEAAMLFANGHDHEAIRALEHALKRSDADAADEQIWLMLFDLYHIGGKREPFDAMALDYAVRFGKSPPTWSGPEAVAGRGGGAAVPLVGFGRALDMTADKPLDMLGRMASRNETVRVDVGTLREAEESRCQRLADMLHAAKKAGHEIILLNPASFARVLEKKVVPGTRENQAAWLLLLELYQQQEMPERFEESALDYAVTFEVSPPSWETKRAKPKPRPASLAGSKGASPEREGCSLSGELRGACAAPLQALKDFATTTDDLEVDLSGLRRIDFVCAGNLLNTLAALASAGKSIRMTGASAAVAALMNVLGINQVAVIERRRY